MPYNGSCKSGHTRRQRACFQLLIWDDERSYYSFLLHTWIDSAIWVKNKKLSHRENQVDDQVSSMGGTEKIVVDRRWRARRNQNHHIRLLVTKPPNWAAVHVTRLPINNTINVRFMQFCFTNIWYKFQNWSFCFIFSSVALCLQEEEVEKEIDKEKEKKINMRQQVEQTMDSQINCSNQKSNDQVS